MILFWGKFFKRCLVQLLSTNDHGFKIQSLEIPLKIVLVCVRISRHPIPSFEWVVPKQGKHRQVLQCTRIVFGGGGIKKSNVLPRQPVFFRATLKKSQDFWKWSGSAELLVTSNASSLLKKRVCVCRATTLPGYWPKKGHFGFGIQEGQPFDSASGQTWEGLLRGKPEMQGCFFVVPFNLHLGVSENGGTPKSSIWIGISIINHPFWGPPLFWKHPFVYFFSIKLQLVTGVFRWTWKFIRALSNEHLTFFQSQATKETPHSGFADWEICFLGLMEILILPTADLLWFQNPNLYINRCMVSPIEILCCGGTGDQWHPITHCLCPISPQESFIQLQLSPSLKLNSLVLKICRLPQKETIVFQPCPFQVLTC